MALRWWSIGTGVLLLAMALPARALPLTVHADAPATWWWLLSALAGDDHGSTPQWRQTWQEQGLGAPDDPQTFQRFAQVRDRYRGPYLHPPPREGSLVPVPPPPSARLETRLAMAFLSSRSLDEAFAKAEVLLQPGDLAELRAVFQHLQPRLDRYWQAQAWLQPWSQRLATWASQRDLAGQLDEVGRLFGLKPPYLQGLRVHVVPAPVGETLHGRRVGTDIVLEVRERDTPERRADVVVHEATHALEEAADLASDVTLQGALLAVETGARGWELLDEGLATAIGQGVVAERWDPKFQESLHKPKSWYVDDAIDPFAKSLFPVVKAALASGRTLDQTARGLADAWRTVQPVETPRIHLGRAVRVARDEAVFGPMQDALDHASSWHATLDEAGALARRYPATTLVVAVTVAELPMLQGQRQDLGLPALKGLQRPGLWTQRRPAGGCVFLVVARDADGLRKSLVALVSLGSVQPGWRAL
jgi:hypothetical protein